MVPDIYFFLYHFVFIGPCYFAEVIEFDPMDEPPSMLDTDVYDFYRPFKKAKSLGHAEINFVKSKISELADAWVPVEGKLAQACPSKFHLRISLNDTRGSILEVVSSKKFRGILENFNKFLSPCWF